MVFLGLSCKKEKISTQSNPLKNFSTVNEAKAYVNIKLQEYSKIIAKLSQNPEMVKLVNQKVAQKFDGDYNVLLKNLVSKQNNLLSSITEKSTQFTSNGKISFASMGNVQQEELDLTVLEEAISDPIVVNGQTLYPQIYIPYFEEQVITSEEISDEVDTCPEYSSNVYSTPVIVCSNGEELPNVDTYYGCAYNQNGILTENIPVDECFSKSNIVWAITLNERVNQYGTITAPIQNTLNQTSIRPDLYIPEMTIKENKESWIKGARDICMYACTSWDNGINPQTGNYESSFWVKPELASTTYNTTVNNIEIRNFSRKEVKNKKSVNINFTYFALSREIYKTIDPCASLLHSLNAFNKLEVLNEHTKCQAQNPKIKIYFYPERGDHLYFIIYEFDTGVFDLNGFKSINIDGNNFSQKILFNSNQSPYLSKRLKILPKNHSDETVLENAAWANIDNTGITFKSRRR